MATPVLLGPLALLAILVLIGLFIVLIVRFARNCPAVIGWIVGGFVLLFLAAIFLPVSARLRPASDQHVQVQMLPLVLVAVLVGAIIAFVKGGRGVRITIGVLALMGLLILPILALFHVRASHVPHQPETVTVSTMPAIWHEGMLDQYAADVYPSQRSAARALGMRVAAALDEVLPGRRENVRVQFTPNTAAPGLAEIIAGGYGSQGGTWTVASHADGTDVSVNLRIFENLVDSPPWAAGQSQPQLLKAGTLEATVQLPDGASTTVTAAFTDKPWVENMSAFLARDPRRQFALARTEQACMSPEEARIQATSAACSVVRNILLRTQGRPVIKADIKVDEADLHSAGLIVDRFAQRLSGGITGRIWREAVLVDISDQKIRQLAAQKIAAVRHHRATWAGMALTLAGMFALILVVYAFLDAATRGYYTWTLRIAVVVLAAGGAFFLLLTA
ncbi:MAG TPA: hypothetical protein P5279_03605 [Anaerohalosphaeraceae bacterium]|jgi:hypothetical protein|nr:hypothetical protein [Anaerohalosphaeraceae bacterium]HRT49555.1 hypothetical protein [Anaerohalosphaeraceae bacterium]HRT85510.1 hypothetical protein [Anaerohalosphaeraceae bacterium]